MGSMREMGMWEQGATPALFLYIRNSRAHLQNASVRSWNLNRSAGGENNRKLWEGERRI